MIGKTMIKRICLFISLMLIFVGAYSYSSKAAIVTCYSGGEVIYKNENASKAFISRGGNAMVTHGKSWVQISGDCVVEQYDAND